MYVPVISVHILAHKNQKNGSKRPAMDSALVWNNICTAILEICSLSKIYQINILFVQTYKIVVISRHAQENQNSYNNSLIFIEFYNPIVTKKLYNYVFLIIKC